MPEPGAARPHNRLAHASSPYLLQHAHNPVDWWPWGPEAIAEARRRDVPIFLSVGYSTCYWCHVMERESFEDAATAREINRRFVPVKVDREERPDLDDVYMAAVQIFSGHGGWPMTVFVEPHDLRPFYCGTYYPPRARSGLPGLTELVQAIGMAWRERRDEVSRAAAQLAEAVRAHLAAGGSPKPIGPAEVARAVSGLLRTHDATGGGFGGAPKFPQPLNLELLLDYLPLAGDEAGGKAAEAVLRRTLDAMALGGLFDQVGGGFHRYCVDAAWAVPHFEKMLYDNALLTGLYGRAAAHFGDRFYERVCRRTIAYVERELTSEEGLFLTAQDAEVGHREGQNYLWTLDQAAEALSESDASFAARVYPALERPNFRDPHHPSDPESGVLALAARPEVLAAELGMNEPELLARLDRVNTALLDARGRRPRPATDDKAIASWNGLMIAGLARASAALGDPEFRRAAERAARAVWETMRDAEGGLWRVRRAGRSGTPAFLEDYGLLAHGLAELAWAGGDGAWAERAIALADRADALFASEDGGWFDVRAEQSELFVRPRTTHDGALPSGSTGVLGALMALHAHTGQERFLERAVRGLAALSEAVHQAPLAPVGATRVLLEILVGGGAGRALLAEAVGAPEGSAASAPGDGPDAAAEPEGLPVAVFASRDRVTVRAEPDADAGVMLELRIADGFHITAASPGDSPAARTLQPLRVGVTGGRGVRAYSSYPEPEVMGEGDLAVRVYRGRVEFPVLLVRDGTWSGRPMLAVSYQACTDRECHEPRTVELDVAIDQG